MLTGTTSFKFKTLAVAASLATSPMSFAQEGDLFVEEILITARKKTESLQDVPLSINAFSEQQIDRLGITTTEQVIKYTPGLSYTKGIGSQDTRPDIRGLTALSGRANIAILVDGVDMTSDALIGTGAGQLITMGLYDTERIEVVRGPQSALFGRNAFGGAINYITKKPSSSFEGNFNVEAGNYDTYKAKLGLSGPMIENKVLYRFTIAHSETGGQYDHPANNNDLGEEDTNAASLALQFLPTDTLEILTRVDYGKQNIELAAVAGLDNSNACVTTDPGARVISQPACAYVANSPLLPPGVTPQGPTTIGKIATVARSDINNSDDDFKGTENKVAQFTTLIDWELSDDYTLTSNTAYTDAQGYDDYDLDHLPTQFTQPGTVAATSFQWAQDDGFNNPLNYHIDGDFERSVFFQDLRLAFDASNDIRWLAGAEYYYEDYDNNDYSRANNAIDRTTAGTTGTLDPGSPFPPPGTPPTTGFVASDLPGNQSRETTAWGIYGSFDWNFVKNWELSLSARYQQEDYTARFDNIVATNLAPQLSSSIGAPPPFPPDFYNDASAAPVRIKGSDNFDTFNPKATLSWFATDSLMVYVSVAKGSKPGGFTFESLLRADDRFYDEEKLYSYELGWKTSWFNDRMIVNGAVFYMSNEDKQANNAAYETPLGAPLFVQTPITYVDNIGRTEVQGLELSIDTIVSSLLSINAAYAYTDTNIEHYNTLNAKGVVSGDIDACTGAAADPDCDLSGNELPFTAKHSLNVSFNFDWSMGDSLDGFSSILGRYRSDRYIDTDNLIELDAYIQWDANIGIRADSFEVLAYVDNAFDDDTTTDAVGFVNFTRNFETLIVAYPYQKRSYGVRFKYMF